ncbi:phosphotransferase enzyme family protein [Imhoffiella purpurea]|uniref:Aminoglycoside phosphotransferase n=1 Tax=Imhoffiella purpurea TaxID=1249627 RepID=W9VCY6_9GAMM|nr:aminoglycoside phosphotransferase family protein [Imhoffiella purpurea]EXJ13902.1 Aminoglycoside phosphotransferase [Imhoffiella purpurea]
MAAAFAIEGDPRDISPLGRGLINETYALTSGGQRYVLQRINPEVFPRPEQIMANLSALSDFMRASGASEPHLPRLIRTRQGQPFASDRAGGLWRMMEFISDSRTLDRIEHPYQAHEVGRILGAFHRGLSELPVERLGLSLPGFHDTQEYLKRLRRQVGGGDSLAATEIGASLAFVDERRGLAAILETARRDGRLPTRVTHGDPKLDNILFSTDGRTAVALIDLDTVQPGLVHHDLADCLRSCCNRRGEGENHTEEVRFDTRICANILAGYARGAGDLLRREEIDFLYDAIRSMPFELGLRFLLDHLQGDRYFRVTEPGENLRKAQVQFALTRSIEQQEREIRSAIADAFG